LGEGADAQVHALADSEQFGSSRPAGAEHTGAVGLVDHQASAVALAALADLAQWCDVSLHREHPVDHDQHPAAVVGGALEHLLELLEAAVAKNAQLCARERAAVED